MSMNFEYKLKISFETLQFGVNWTSDEMIFFEMILDRFGSERNNSFWNRKKTSG